MPWIVTTDDDGKPKIKSEDDLRRERNFEKSSVNDKTNVEIFDEDWEEFFNSFLDEDDK